MFGTTSRTVPQTMSVFNFMTEFFSTIGISSIMVQQTANKGMTLVSDGSTATWTFPNRISSWTTANRPTPAAAGMIGFNTTLVKFEGYDGTAWQLLH